MCKFIMRLIRINFLITYGLISMISINYFYKVNSFEVNVNTNITHHNIVNADDDKDNENGENRYEESRNYIINDDNDDGYGGLQEDNDEDDDEMKNDKQRILSRKRRYLIFPEGSSLQVVFDQIIPIVDYTNYLILGITVALAWELPSKKPTELFDEFKQKLNEGAATFIGTEGHRYDENIKNLYFNEKNYEKPLKFNNLHNNNYNFDYNTNLKYDLYEKDNPYSVYNSKDNHINWNRYQLSEAGFHPPMDLNYYNFNNHENLVDRFDHFHHPSNSYGNLTWNRYENNNNNNHRDYLKKSNSYQTQHTWKKYPWRKFYKKISDGNTIGDDDTTKDSYIGDGSRNSLKRRPINSGNSGGYHYRNGIRKHRIYPVFGKRSIETHQLTIEDKFHLHYHRTSRHGLYLKIEKYLHTRGINGSECILKTLCETGQKRNETEPGSLIAEIMRVIFTLPQNFDPDFISSHKHKEYDDAHLYDGDCNQKYPQCPGSLWNDFIL